MTSTKLEDAARPVVKWAGGKKRLLQEVLNRTPEFTGTYYEPFAGGAAVFFDLYTRGRLQPGKVVLSDTNDELITAYKVIQSDQVTDLIHMLRTLTYGKEEYYAARNDWVPTTQVQKAARFIYLNKTCFNGLYRVNKAGKFNVPFGRYVNPLICDETALWAAHRALQGVTLKCEEFQQVLVSAVPGDFVYFDPPYIPRTVTASFTSYTSKGFNYDAQCKLRDEFKRLTEAGVYVLLSNSDTELSRSLYEQFPTDTVHAPRSINSKGSSRGLVTEIMVRGNL